MAEDWRDGPGRSDDSTPSARRSGEPWWRDPLSPTPPAQPPANNWPPTGTPLQPLPVAPVQPPRPAQPVLPYPPAPPPVIPVQDLPLGTLRLEGRTYGPAGFGPRLRAFLIDWLLLVVLLGGLAYVVDLPRPDTSRILQVMGRQLQDALHGKLVDDRTSQELTALLRPQRFLGWLNVGLCACYFILFHGLAGATLGKAACGLTVLRRDGQPLGLARAALRYLGYFVLAKAFYGTFSMPFDPERRAVHDFICGGNVYRQLRWR